MYFLPIIRLSISSPVETSRWDVSCYLQEEMGKKKTTRRVVFTVKIADWGV